MRNLSGATILCRALAQAGVSHVFGVPGTQNIHLFEALRRSPIRTVLGVSELSCAFMANGYYRASGRPGVLTTIPGPGFAFCLAGIAEAAHDSAALVYILIKPRSRNRKFDLQSLDQAAMLHPLVKGIVDVSRASAVQSAAFEAFSLSLAGEPGPVVLHIDAAALTEQAQRLPDTAIPPRNQPNICPVALSEAARLLRQARHPVLFLGQGAAGASAAVVQLAENLNIPVVTTRSGRGVVPETHRLALVFDISETGLRALNALLDRSDRVLAIGCKFTHNGSYGFQLRLPQEKLIHVDASAETLGANYPAQLALHSDAPVFLDRLLELLAAENGGNSQWSSTDFQSIRERNGPASDSLDPEIDGFAAPAARTFFSELREAMPPGSCLVTDSGRHQVLATHYYRVLEPRGMMIPSDFQSMGFGLPAAIGAKLSAPDRPVVALIGDGGLAMSGTELATAVRERIPLTVIVFNDGALGQIRAQQFSSFGQSCATTLLTPNLALFAQSLGANYIRLNADSKQAFASAILSRSVTLVEVAVTESTGMRASRAKGVLRRVAKESRSLRAIRSLLRPA
jgi:acetolactate synthase I/II/III large subunit